MVREENRFPAPPVPNSIMDAAQKELSDLEMEIMEGSLPDDLQGYIFMVAPAGNTNDPLPYQDGNTFLSGDGMIYRLDLTESGKVKLTTQIVEPPDYLADLKTQNNFLLKFRNHGVVRFSLLLGSRNLLNTAFLPVKFAEDDRERLLVTYDAGRPYEINSKTLSLLNPVGTREEWDEAIKLPSLTFSPILSTAHPAFDTYTQQMFTVNYGRSLSNFLGKPEGKEYLEFLNEIQSSVKQDIDRNSGKQQVNESQQQELQVLGTLIERLLKLINFVADDFVNLISWENKSSIKKWQLINPDGSPIRIRQSIHQIGVTQKYVILLDTSFAIGIEHILGDCSILTENYRRGGDKFATMQKQDFCKWLREIFQSELKPSVDSIFYLVRREDLKDEEKPVVAHQIKIPGEASHFLVDFDNSDRKITLHVAHIAAWHVAEWMRRDDTSPYPDKRLRRDLWGMQQCEMDISRMGRYEIDFSQEQPEITAQKVITDELCTWGPGLFAYQDRLPSTGKTPQKLDNIYWISFGLWDDLMTDDMYQLYQDYEYRIVSLEDLLEKGKSGIPATLFRLDTSSNESMAIADYYEFPPSHIALSPQFVPRAKGSGDSTDGYIFCLVFNPEGDEIWVFDAGDLKQPVCKLRHPKLNFAFSLHSTWLSDVSDRQPDPSYSVREDYEASVKQLFNVIDNNLSFSLDKETLKQTIADLFEKHIY